MTITQVRAGVIKSSDDEVTISQGIKVSVLLVDAGPSGIKVLMMADRFPSNWILQDAPIEELLQARSSS